MTMITTKNVAAGFDEVAPRYDLMVALNPGYHTHLREAADVLIHWLPHPEASNGQHPVGLLDLGCGSGASTRAILQAAQAAGLRYNVVGVDASTGMVDQARAKHWPEGVRFDSIQTFVDRLYRAGFTDVEVRTAPGWQRGILHTFRARKPASIS